MIGIDVSNKMNTHDWSCVFDIVNEFLRYQVGKASSDGSNDRYLPSVFFSG